MFLLNNRHVLIKLQLEEDYAHIWVRQTYYVSGRFILIFKCLNLLGPLSSLLLFLFGCLYFFYLCISFIAKIFYFLLQMLLVRLYGWTMPLLLLISPRKLEFSISTMSCGLCCQDFGLVRVIIGFGKISFSSVFHYIVLCVNILVVTPLMLVLLPILGFGSLNSISIRC